MQQDIHSTITLPVNQSSANPYTDTVDNTGVSTANIAGVVTKHHTTKRHACAASATIEDNYLSCHLRVLDHPIHPGVAFSARNKKLQYKVFTSDETVEWMDVPIVKSEDL